MLRQFNVRFLLAVAGLLLGLYMSRGGTLINRRAPDFSLPGVYGGRVDLDSYRGRPVLLVFWTSSCSICQDELPMLSRLEPSFRSKGATIVAIHLGGEEEAAEYLGANSINLMTVYDADGAVARQYGVSGVPKLVLVGADGNIKRSHSGWTDETVLRHWIN
jgi:peroxiredoxin